MRRRMESNLEWGRLPAAAGLPLSHSWLDDVVRKQELGSRTPRLLVLTDT
jgi:hypothetical protein